MHEQSRENCWTALVSYPETTLIMTDETRESGDASSTPFTPEQLTLINEVVEVGVTARVVSGDVTPARPPPGGGEPRDHRYQVRSSPPVFNQISYR